MWRPNPRYSREILWRRILTRWDAQDNLGNPAQEAQAVPIYAEVYSGVDPVSRQAFGLEKDEAVTVFWAGKPPKEEDQLVISHKVYRIISVSQNDPIRIVGAAIGKEGEGGKPGKPD